MIKKYLLDVVISPLPIGREHNSLDSYSLNDLIARGIIIGIIVLLLIFVMIFVFYKLKEIRAIKNE